MNPLSLNQRLASDRFLTDESASHITVDQELARSTGTAERLIAICPAGVYSRAADGSLAVEYAACLECGTCLAVADPGTLTWHYPAGGHGVQFREG
ncbi:MAG: 4Fe-4S dicluster domain-containing protein [Propionibacteriaceae bacterium]|jgi:ferredoxin like protein|nr:4Fe-4S dicluster domain-containing protein [Propionibacteriaceae bacterium]